MEFVEAVETTESVFDLITSRDATTLMTTMTMIKNTAAPRMTRPLSSRQSKKQKNLRNIQKQSVQIVQAAIFLLMKRGIPSQ